MERINARSIVGLSALAPVTAAHALTAIAGAMAGSLELQEVMTRSWSASIRGLAGARLHVERSPALDPRRTYVFVANHRSHLDVPCIYTAWTGPIRFVAKKSLFAIPIFGHALAALGHIPVDRRNREQAKASLQKAVEPVRNRYSVLFFAEGTRSETDELRPFKKGFLNLAEVAQVPVVPIGIVGTGDILAKGSVALNPGDVGIVFGDPVAGAGDPTRDRDERVAEVRAAVARAMERAAALRAGAGR